MNLYEVVYQDRTGKQFKRIIWANSNESAWARAQRGKKSSVIISFKQLFPKENIEIAEM